MSENRRSFTLDRAGTVRAAGAPGGMKFRGHAAVFGDRAWIPEGRGFWEEITKGAFDNALEEDDVRLLLEHDPRWILGRTSSGTLRLSTDKRGLVVDAELPSWAADVAESLDRGDLSQMSFAFDVRENGEEISTLKDGSTLRRLTDLSLSDVSIVAYPAYKATDASLRSLKAFQQQQHTERRAWLETARKEMSR